MANSNITKKALAESLKELGSTRILDKITVADITEHCGVNRQTFYYHFNDKYELDLQSGTGNSPDKGSYFW